MKFTQSDTDVDYESEEFLIGGFKFEVTTIAYLPIETLMANAAKDVEISGQKLWCGSLAVAEYLLGNTSWIKDCTVVELGAGTGVLGMLCKRLGARRVVLTDNDIRSLHHMKSDCTHNNVEAEVVALDWFTADCAALSPLDCPLRLVAGDVLYKKVLLAPFMRTVRDILSSGSGEAEMLLCHVPRAGVQQADVVSCALENSLTAEPQPKESWCHGAVTEYCPMEDSDRAVLYVIKCK